jgi:hypothetical protein
MPEAENAPPPVDFSMTAEIAVISILAEAIAPASMSKIPILKYWTAFSSTACESLKVVLN